MVRPRQDPAAVASRVVSVRLTPKESDLLDQLVDAANLAMKKQGFPALVTPASLLKSFLLRQAAEAGLGTEDVHPVRVRAPIVVHPPRIRPKGHRGPLPSPTTFNRFDRINADNIVPAETTKKEPTKSLRKRGAPEHRKK